MLHSGSRGVGNQLATRHIEVARNLAAALDLRLEDPDLAWFTEGTPEFAAYVADLLWAQSYAAANRDQMISRAVAAAVVRVLRARRRPPDVSGQARRTLTAASLAEAMGDRSWQDRSAEDLVDEHPAVW